MNLDSYSRLNPYEDDKGIEDDRGSKKLTALVVGAMLLSSAGLFTWVVYSRA